MKIINLILIVAVSLLWLQGCTINIPYQEDTENFVGYHDVQLTKNTFSIKFTSNTYDDNYLKLNNQQLVSHLKRRIAEITIENGFKYFEISGAESTFYGAPTAPPYGMKTINTIIHCYHDNKNHPDAENAKLLLSKNKNN
tara:strand:- start:83 stop:502 length:420 start_codon:yes stop_codon:yes gene_type:complete